MDGQKFFLDEINLHSVFMALVRNIWVIVLLCASVLMSYSAVKRLTYEPCYTASATFMVGAKDSSNAYNSLTVTQSMANVFVEVFQSNVLRQKVQEQMGEEKFTGVVETTTIPETNLLIVRVTSPTPAMSFRGLRLIIENYSDISDYLFSNAQLDVIKDPVVPMVPSNPMNYRENYPILAVLTAIASVTGIVAICVLRDTVQSPKAARRKVDARLLRTVHHERTNKTLNSKYRKKHVAPLITSPLIRKGFIEDNISLCAAVEYHMRKRHQKVILVVSAGENEGKSTIAANLALSLTQKNKKVVLLDCDFRKPSLHKVLETPMQETRVFSKYLSSNDGNDPTSCLVWAKKHGITVGFSRPEHKNINKLLNSGNLQRFISQIREKADYVILDTSPMLAAADAETIAAMADTAILVVRADYMHTTAVNDCLEKLRSSTPDVCGFVLNNFHRSILS